MDNRHIFIIDHIYISSAAKITKNGNTSLYERNLHFEKKNVEANTTQYFHALLALSLEI
jgi:hypothetical protein